MPAMRPQNWFPASRVPHGDCRLLPHVPVQLVGIDGVVGLVDSRRHRPIQELRLNTGQLSLGGLGAVGLSWASEPPGQSSSTPQNTDAAPAPATFMSVPFLYAIASLRSAGDDPAVPLVIIPGRG